MTGDAFGERFCVGQGAGRDLAGGSGREGDPDGNFPGSVGLGRTAIVPADCRTIRLNIQAACARAVQITAGATFSTTYT